MVGGDVDDDAAHALFHHVAGRGLRAEIRAAKVRADHRVKELGRGLQEGLEARDARVVDHEVHVVIDREERLEHLLDLVVVSDVRVEDLGPGAERARLLGGVQRAVGGGGVVDAQVIPGLGQLQGDALADAAARTRHQCDFPAHVVYPRFVFSVFGVWIQRFAAWTNAAARSAMAA